MKYKIGDCFEVGDTNSWSWGSGDDAPGNCYYKIIEKGDDCEIKSSENFCFINAL